MKFVKGMDLSTLLELEKCGAKYYVDGTETDILDIMKKYDVDTIRIRLWNDPWSESGESYGAGENDLKTTLAIAKKVTDAGLGVLLNFHYSDFWADPGKQIKPKAWEGYSVEELEQAVYDFTADTMKVFKENGINTTMVQVGNEITNGFLWPDGHVKNLAAMAGLLQAGIYAVKEECPEARIVLHLDFGTDAELYERWFDAIEPFDIDYDIIGMSYYPHWNGGLNLLLDNMNRVSQKYGKDVMIAETSIGYTTDTLGCTGLVFTQELEKNTGYPATEAGQMQFLSDLFEIVRSVSGGHGIGVFYWEPAWLPIPTCTWANANGRAYMNDQVEAGNSMANQALFDRDGNANAALLNLKQM